MASVCNAIDLDVYLTFFDNFVIFSSFFVFHRMMTFNNKFKKKQTLYKKKVIKILFLNLLRQNSKVYSLASRFDVQRNNVHLHGGLIKKQSLNILVVHKTVVLVIAENVLQYKVDNY